VSSERSNRITKTLTIDQAPRVLVLQLKRFQFDHRTHDSVKTQVEVSFPAILQIPTSCLSKDLQSKLQTKANKVYINTKQLNTPSTSDITYTATTPHTPVDDGGQSTPSKSRKSRRKKNAAAAAAAVANAAAVTSPAKHVPGMPPRPPPASNSPIPLSLDDAPVGGGGGQEGLRYRLQSVVLHHGTSAHSGHYTCLVRRRVARAAAGAGAGAGGGGGQYDYEWVHIDDENVSRVTEKFVFESMQSQVSTCR
jgi:hypothetical protein